MAGRIHLALVSKNIMFLLRLNEVTGGEMRYDVPDLLSSVTESMTKIK